jgi:large subunit ribosomal protein L20
VPRVKRGTKRRASRKKTLALAKGFFLTKSKLHRAAQEAVEKSLRYGYVGRRLKKRDFRSLWIVRIGAACRQSEISYSRFMNGLKLAGVDLNRKILADMAMNDPTAFAALAAQAKAAIAQAPAGHAETARPQTVAVEKAPVEAAHAEPAAAEAAPAAKKPRRKAEPATKADREHPVKPHQEHE